MRTKKSDYILSLTVLALLIFGLVMISSTSVVLSYDRFQSNNYYLIRQVINAVIGVLCLIAFSLIDYKMWKRFAGVLLFFSIVLLFLVFLVGFSFGGAKRWLTLGNFFLQPTEITKLTYIIYLAAWLESRGEKVRNLQYGLIPFGLMTIFIGGLILLQPDMGTAIVISFTAASMYVVAGASLQHILIAGAGSLAVGWLLIKSSAYRFARLTVFLNPGADTQGIGYHINQALLAIGSGGILGLGFGASRQKYNYLPEPMGDSIFAIIAEEMGFIRAGILVFLFFVLAYKGYKISRECPDVFGRLVAFGITTWITFQAVVNVAAMLSLVPLTGIPLPFISYGGSSLITTLAGAGILLNISKSTEKGASYESPNQRRWYSRSYYARHRGSRRAQKRI